MVANLSCCLASFSIGASNWRFLVVSGEYCSSTPMLVPLSLLALFFMFSLALCSLNLAIIALGLPCLRHFARCTLSKDGTGRPIWFRITSFNVSSGTSPYSSGMPVKMRLSLIERSVRSMIDSLLVQCHCLIPQCMDVFFMNVYCLLQLCDLCL